MIYVGFVISMEEALRLLKLEDSFVKTYYDTKPIQDLLADFGSHLVFEYMDKGACLFAMKVQLKQEPSIEETIFQLIAAKKQFLTEITALKIQIDKVNLTRIEEESWLVENPEPYVISL
jgi:hypothetical protein